MRDDPDGTELLRHARALLLGDLLPALPEDLRHQVRLIAKALAIAAAEQTAGTGPLEAEADALAELYGEARTPATREAEAVAETLLRLNWRLASEIRGAKRDGEAQVYAILRAAMQARLREVNPKLLEDENLA